MASKTREGDSDDLRVMAQRAAWRACLLAFGWWALLEDDVAGIPFGVLVVLIGTLVSLRLCPRDAPLMHIRLVACVRLAWHFLIGSMRGGWDVARLALSRRMRAAPEVVSYTTGLAPGPDQWLFTGVINLMPGSLTVEARDRELLIHVLVGRGDLKKELQKLEGLIAKAVWPEATSKGGEHA